MSFFSGLQPCKWRELVPSTSGTTYPGRSVTSNTRNFRYICRSCHHYCTLLKKKQSRMVSVIKFVWFVLWKWHQMCFVFRLLLLILWQCKRITCKSIQYIFRYDIFVNCSWFVLTVSCKTGSPISFSFSVWEMEYHKSAIVSWDIETMCLETIYPQGFSNEVTKA